MAKGCFEHKVDEKAKVADEAEYDLHQPELNTHIMQTQKQKYSKGV